MVQHLKLFFVNKTVEVTGEAKRVKIYFISNGMLTDKYYFQTHINVPSNLKLKLSSLWIKKLKLMIS